MAKVYHTGELLAQQKANEAAMGERNGRVVANTIIPGARNFIEKLPFVIVSTQNKDGDITVSPLSGRDGFIRIKDERSIEVDVSLCTSNPYDSFWRNIRECPMTGWLFIEPSTRRRFRLNGSIVMRDEKIVVSVDQAYPNCPKYIQQRNLTTTGTPQYSDHFDTGEWLTDDVVAMIGRADTLFVGSSDAHGNMDVSHRGGLPGFIHIVDAKTLSIPDYAGNSMYNTLGNFIVNPSAGILIIDFNNGTMLQLNGAATVHWDVSDGAVNTGGTNRCWTFELKSWKLSENLKCIHTSFVAYSPFNPPVK